MSRPNLAERREKSIHWLPSGPGTYVLLMEKKPNRNGADAVREIRIGKLGNLALHPGYYLYVGSAHGPGGLRARLGRHLRRNPTRRWHIDYLKPHAAIVAVWYLAGTGCYEHLIAGILREDLFGATPLPRFGSSDCDCPAHLFFFATRPEYATFCDRLQKRAAGVNVFELILSIP